MNLKELDSFKMSDAISFHDELNPNLWDGQTLHPEVKEQLLYIAKDFLEELGVNDLDVVDITVSGSNAAFSYTPHSDLDLHILVDLSKLDNDEIYRELFNAKKSIYNDTHNITIHGVPVELYVQDAREPVVSLGEYSILHDKWLRIPTKRRANLDQTATKQKYEKLLDIIKRTLKAKNIVQVNKIIQKIKQYRKAGLDKGGEFGPENLAYKILRKQGLIDKLYNLRDKLHSEHLTIEENNPLLDKPTPTIREVAKKHGVSFTDIMNQLVMGVNVELEHTNDEKVAREIALDHLSEDPEYYTKLKGAELEEDSYSMYPNPNAAEKTLPVTPYGNKERQFRGAMAEGSNDYLWHGSKSKHDVLYPQQATDTGGAEGSNKNAIYATPDAKVAISMGLTTPGSDTGMFPNDPQMVLFKGDIRNGEMIYLHKVPKDLFIKHNSREWFSKPDVKEITPIEIKAVPVDKYLKLIRKATPQDLELRKKYMKKEVSEASGYIPSEKEKNDPRFKTALTVDVHPNTMKKDAKKFGNTISRAGIPPTLQPSGKF